MKWGKKLVGVILRGNNLFWFKFKERGLIDVFSELLGLQACPLRGENNVIFIGKKSG